MYDRVRARFKGATSDWGFIRVIEDGFGDVPPSNQLYDLTEGTYPTYFKGIWDVGYDHLNPNLPKPIPGVASRRWHPLYVVEYDQSEMPVIEFSMDSTTHTHIYGKINLLYDMFAPPTHSPLGSLNGQMFLRVPPSDEGQYDVSELGTDASEKIGAFQSLPVYLAHMDGIFDSNVGVRLNAQTQPFFIKEDLLTNMLENALQWLSMFSIGGKLAYEKGLPSLAPLNLLRKTANANLLYQFGWKPLLSDVQAMVSFGDELSKRLSTIKQIIAKQPLTRRGSPERVSDEEDWSEEVQTQPYPGFDLGITYQVRYKRKTQGVRTGFVTYEPDPSLVAWFTHLSESQRKFEAFKSAYLRLSLTPAASLWELLPWSWLVDWFLPIQDFLEQYSNQITIQPSGVWFTKLQRTDVEVTFSPVFIPDGMSVTGWGSFRGSVITKERYHEDADLSLHLPNLQPFIDKMSFRRIGILASTFVQRLPEILRRL